MKWKVQRGVSGKPFTHFGMFMGSVVIDDGMDRLSLRHPRFDGVEEADELLMAVSFHVLPDDGAIEDIEGSKQRRGAMPFVVMRHCAGAARFHRQARLGAVERLDLALFVDREDHRMSGRVPTMSQAKTKGPTKSKKSLLPNTSKLKRVAKEAAVAAGVAALDTALSAMEPQRKDAAGSGAEKKDDPSKN